MEPVNEALLAKLVHHLDAIYGDISLAESTLQIAKSLMDVMRLNGELEEPVPHTNHWNEQDVVLITYADTILNGEETPLQTLATFLDNYCKDVINSVHILPFFPFTSDDGFAVSNFVEVNPRHGDWVDISHIASNYRLMSDLVINHCSASNGWFEKFKKGQYPETDYFISLPPDTDTSLVVRPRITPLLTEVFTEKGLQHVWCTFGPDQVDLNFRNPAVLTEFVKIIRLYLDKGVRIFRFDAVAFIWKQLGSNCINLPQTHEIIRLLRTLVEYAQNDAVIITETNIPNRENLSYFGNANEAHAIYNFSLPPLLLSTLVNGDCSGLKSWMMRMPPAQQGTTYLNFIASHDGIGLRPVEGLIDDDDLADLITCMESFGGLISWRSENGTNKPYEINISLFDALQGTVAGKDSLGVDRFVCAHAIMLALEGIPAIYIHSFLGTGNHPERVVKSGSNRSINRHQWNCDELLAALDDSSTQHHQVYFRLRELLIVRKAQPAFHPNATQFTLHLGAQLFGFWRQSIDRRQSIFCLYNISHETQNLMLSDINLIETEDWRDLISGDKINDTSGSIKLQPYQALWLTNSQ